MDYIVEIIVLGIDSLVLITSLKQYCKKSSSVARVSNVSSITVDSKLEQLVKNQPNAKLPYIAIRGAVSPIGVPITSSNNPNVSGVIQTLKIKEHVVQRSSSGFWSDSERTIQEVYNVIPFGLKSKNTLIEVTDPLVAEYLDMEVISDKFTPTVPSMMDHIWGFFSGYRQRGVQTTEKMLREGAVLTGIGELVYEQDGSLKLQPPTNGGLYYLTTLPVKSLLKKLENSKKNYGILTLICTTIGVVCVGLIVRKYWKEQKMIKDEEDKKTKLKEFMKNRRKLMRDVSDLPDNKLCVVCKSNPLEVILLPCGHVCLCGDCAEAITSDCPLCRSIIEMKSPAYVP